VAALVYRRNRHVINLFVCRRSPGRSCRRTAAAQRLFGAHWRSHGLEFWAVSDIEAGDLEAFRRAYRGPRSGLNVTRPGVGRRDKPAGALVAHRSVDCLFMT